MSIKRRVLALLIVSAALAVAAHADSSPDKVQDAALVGKDWHYDATIVGNKEGDDKSIFGTYDVVYLNAGTQDGLTPGTRCAIYQKGDTLKDPETGDSVGNGLKRIGVLQITNDAADHRSSGLILSSADAIEVGDLVKKE